MKKLLIFMLVLGMTSSAWATLAEFIVSPSQPSYEPSDYIFIGIVADFYVGNFGIDDILTDNGGTASDPALHELLQTGMYSDGIVENTGGLLIRDPYGQISGYEIEEGVPPGEVVWGFVYHVPDVPYSTVITISASGTVFIADAWYGEYVESMGPITIHVVPEPATIALLGLGGLLLRRRR